MFCDDCAANIVSVSEKSTDQLVTLGRDTMPLTPSPAKPRTAIVFYVRGAKKPFVIPHGKRVLLGRNSPDESKMPDIDLTPYNGIERGVSRNHAVIDNTGSIPTIIDVGSSNGVHINGSRLRRGTTSSLGNGDHVFLGRLPAFVQLKQMKARQPEPMTH